MKTQNIKEPSVCLDDVLSLCKRRGFIFQSSSIYGGVQGLYDFGPLGVELKKNLKTAWWESMVYARDDVEGLDSSILTHQSTLKHSGHEKTFSDPMVDCKDCKHRMRFDHIVDGKCDNCSSRNLTEPKQFNLMLKTNYGPVDTGSNFVYLRPETAQGIFTNFKNVLDSTSRKVPFGIAQIGKAFRNEVTPRNFIFRTREFEQMELEFFIDSSEDEKWFAYWVTERYNWWIKQGLSKDNLVLAPQDNKELAHYSKATTDILYRFPFGTEELEGIANRTDYDLGSHSKNQLDVRSKVEPNTNSIDSLLYQDIIQKRSYIPFVIEPSCGVERGILALLVEAYTYEQLDEAKSRIVLKLKPHLAPVKVAVIPLAKNNPRIVEKAKAIRKALQQLNIGLIRYEDIGNIGKIYRRHDEIGTPLCITVDFDTFEGTQETVTVRDRDTMEQARVAVNELGNLVKKFFLRND